MISSEICDLYRHLPVSVLIFRDEKELLHINKHLLEMFCVDEVISNFRSIVEEVYYSIFEYFSKQPVRNDIELFKLLSQTSRFEYKDHFIQIDTSTHDEYTVFVLTLVKPYNMVLPMDKKHINAQQSRILDIFTRTKRPYFGIFSMFKGLHIRSNAEFKGIENNSIVLKVPLKHFSSYEDNNEYILIPNPGGKNVVVANAVKTDPQQGLIYLSNLSVSSQTAMDRRTIRVKCEDEDIAVTVNETHEYKLYDFSYYALTITCNRNDKYFEQFGANDFSLKFTLSFEGRQEQIAINAKLIKMMVFKDFTKVVLGFKNNPEMMKKFKAYLNFRQLRLMKELQSFTEQLVPKKTEPKQKKPDMPKDEEINEFE